MKPITNTLTSLPVNGNFSGAERTADDDARVRRDAERAKLRRLQNDKHQHAEAESRLADAMARASARTSQLARSAGSLHQSPVLPAMAGAAEAGIAEAARATTQAHTARMSQAKLHTETEAGPDTELAASAADDRSQRAADLADPVSAVLQRLARGQSRGLLQDCAPMLESIAARLANGSMTVSEDAHGDGESLACALDFLQGYADAAAGRVAGADKTARLLTDIRQQLEALMPDAKSSTGLASAASQQLASHSPASGQTHRLSNERERVRATRKQRPGRELEGDSDADGTQAAAGALAVDHGSGAAQGKVTTVSESSLDKDQRKRREDTLPLVTLRSI